MSSTKQSQFITLENFLKRFDNTKKPTGGASEYTDHQIIVNTPPFSASTMYKNLKKWHDLLKPFALEKYTLFNMEPTLKNNIKRKNTPDSISKDAADRIIPSRLYLYFGYLEPKDSKENTLQKLSIPAIDFPFLFSFFNVFPSTIKNLSDNKISVLNYSSNFLRKFPDEFISPDSQAFTDTIIRMCQGCSPKPSSGPYYDNYKDNETFTNNILNVLSKYQNTNQDVHNFLKKLYPKHPQITIQDFWDNPDTIETIFKLFIDAFVNEYITFFQNLLDLMLPNELFVLVEEFNKDDNSQIPDNIKNIQTSSILYKLFKLKFPSVEAQKNFYEELNSLLNKNETARYLFKDEDKDCLFNLIKTYITNGECLYCTY